MDSYPVNGDQMYTRNTSYNLDLKPGWNLIKYEISEIFTDEGGKTYPVRESYTSISELPSDLQYVFLPERGFLNRERIGQELVAVYSPRTKVF